MKILTIDNDRIQKGIFFRLPIQTRYFDNYTGEDYSFIEKCKRNIFLKLINYKLYKQCINEKWFDDIDLAGINGKVFTSFIYFSRSIRETTHYITNHPEISKIHAIGEEPYKNQCSGACICEKTTIYFHNRKKQIIKKKKSFHYYYNHIIKDLLKNKGE